MKNTKKIKEYETGKNLVLSHYDEVKKNYESCEKPLYDENQQLSPMLNKIDEYYTELKAKFVKNWIQSEEEIGFDKAVNYLCKEYDKLIAKLKDGETVKEDKKFAERQEYVLKKYVEISILAQKLDILRVAFKSILMQEKMNTYGPFGLEGTEVFKDYAQDLCNLDLIYSLAIDNNKDLQTQADMYDKIMDSNFTSLAVEAE